MTKTIDLRRAAHPLIDDDRRWAFAVGAPYHVAQGYALDGLDPIESDDPQREMLDDGWDIRDRDALVAQLTRLGLDGHRQRFVPRLRYYAMLWRPQVAAMREEQKAAIREGGDEAEGAEEALWRLDAVQADVGGIRRSTLLAFDAARAVMLTRAGLMLGWLTEAEAWPYLLDVARDVQRTYDSWDAYARDFVLSRNVWAGKTNDDVFDASTELLLARAESPWRTLPWARPSLAGPRDVGATEPAELYWSLERAG